ncbi:MAG: NAD(P)H-dependent oxidoreductase [Candidatus Omnitrophota bacterium]|nr:NAD(P)H-dependent oxidoreductase [Candidatus Omnitrophota bacterium]
MNALGIVAGPRKGQVTDNLVGSALKALSDRGAAAEKIYLVDLSIKPCMACFACQRTGQCVVKDDFQSVVDKVRRADVLVFGSPTYFSNVTSSAKVFIDRGYSMFKENPFGLTYLYTNPKKVILITSCGAPFPFSHLLGISTGCMRAMKVFFKYTRAGIKTLTAASVKDFDPKTHAKLLRRAYDLGRTI